METDQLVKVGAAAVGAGAAYKFLYLPYAAKKEMERLAALKAAELAKSGGGGSALANVLGEACMQAAELAHIPPAMASLSCKGAGLLATKGLELAGKGALAVGKGIGKGAVVVGKGAAAAGKAVGEGAAFVAYKAPKAAVTSVLHMVGIGGSSKLGRAANNKDVFPNDLELCKRLFGITDWRECGLKYDLAKHSWPWDAKGNLKGLTGLSPYETSLEGLAGAPRKHPLAVHARNMAKRPVAPRSGSLGNPQKGSRTLPRRDSTGQSPVSLTRAPRPTAVKAKQLTKRPAKKSPKPAISRARSSLDSTARQIDPYAAFW